MYPVAACRGGHVMGAGAAAASSAIVSGAGTAAVNGTYTERGTSDGKPYYNLEGQPDNTGIDVIVWQTASVRWVIYTNDSMYQSTDAVAFPWLVTTWVALEGSEPVPTVTEG